MSGDLVAHPAADVWPMLPDDELKTLAQSIADVGLLEPIVLTGDGLVLDGRNRLAACAIAGVEPRFITTFADPVAYVLARNDARRHMTKGQRALAAVLTASATGSLTINATEVARAADLNDGMVRWARAVADDGPRLLGDAVVGDVLDGRVALKAAFDDVVRARRDDAMRAANLDELAARAPDLATEVREDRLPIADALYQMRQREQARLDARRDARNLLARVLDLVTTDADALAGWADRLDAEPDLVAATRAAGDALHALADRMGDPS